MPTVKPTYHYVYILRSISFPNQTYIGYTTDFASRLCVHNSGRSHHTSKYCPWSMETVIRFTKRSIALAFERYLKSHSGKAFANKRLLSPR
jgi:putative endonuclease